MRVTVPFTYENDELEIEAEVHPGRPAPPCSNPDSPAFSDSGDPAEVEVLECSQITDDGHEDYNYDHLPQNIKDQIEDKLIEASADLYNYTDDDRAFDTAREDGRLLL